MPPKGIAASSSTWTPRASSRRTTFTPPGPNWSNGSRRWASKPGQRAVVSVGNGPQFVATLLGVLAAGGSPLLVHAKTPAAELKRTALRFGAHLSAQRRMPAGGFAGRVAHGFGPVGRRLDSAGLPDASTPPRPGFNCRVPHAGGRAAASDLGNHRPAESRRAARARAATEEARHYIETIGVTADDAIMAIAADVSRLCLWHVRDGAAVERGVGGFDAQAFSRAACFRGSRTSG